MARVDFYVLKQSGEDARKAFCCKLVEKAYNLDNTVHIHVASDVDAKTLDTLLWTFRDDSFLPHEIEGSGDASSPISIGSANTNTVKNLLINLGSSVPEFANQYERIAEIVSNDDDIKIASRQRFAEYRDSGHTIETHKL